MSPPLLSWFPVRLVAAVHDGEASASEWIAAAPRLGFPAVELHASFVATEPRLSGVERALERARVAVSMITGAPDFVDPDPDRRAGQLAAMRRLVRIAHRLSIPTVRATAGPERPGVAFDDALPRIVDAIGALAAYAEERDVTVCVENHYRDRTWEADAIDITAPRECFAQLLAALRETPVRVNYDSAQPMVTGCDGIQLLDAVADRLAHVHLGDRRRGERAHAVIGEGDVDFDAVLSRLHAIGYDRYLTVEDGNPEGELGLRRGTEFLHARLAATWRDA